METQRAPQPGKRGPYAKTRARRERIVVAAHEVFATHGYRGGSLAEVAEKVGMSQSSLLHHFGSKRELLLAVLHLRDESRVGTEPGVAEGEGFAERVLSQAVFNESIPGVIELYTVLCAESLTEGHPGSDYFAARYERLREGYTAEFRRLAAEGRLRPGTDPARAAATLLALWDGIQTQWLIAPEAVDMAACLRDYLDLVLLPG